MDLRGIGESLIDDYPSVLLSLVDEALHLAYLLLQLVLHCRDIHIQAFCVDESLIEVKRESDIK